MLETKTSMFDLLASSHGINILNFILQKAL